MDTKTDRELIELAAKALGVDVEFDDLNDPYIDEPIGGASGLWNPLYLDDDAFRLMCELGLDVIFMHGFKQIYCYRRIDQDRAHMHGIVGFGNGSCKKYTNHNVRRSIVMAAAKIGECVSD